MPYCTQYTKEHSHCHETQRKIETEEHPTLLRFDIALAEGFWEKARPGLYVCFSYL